MFEISAGSLLSCKLVESSNKILESFMTTRLFDISPGFSLRGNHPATDAFNAFLRWQRNGTMAYAPLASVWIRAIPLPAWMNRPETWRVISFGSWAQRGACASFFFSSYTVSAICSSTVMIVATECLLRHLLRCLYRLTSVAGINFSQCSGRWSLLQSF